MNGVRSIAEWVYLSAKAAQNELLIVLEVIECSFKYCTYPLSVYNVQTLIELLGTIPSPQVTLQKFTVELLIILPFCT